VKLQSARTSVSMRTLRSVGLACRPRQARSVCLARLLHVDLLFGASVRAQLAGAIGDTTDRCCGKAAILRGWRVADVMATDVVCVGPAPVTGVAAIVPSRSRPVLTSAER
jgi:hypothetical protein